MNYKAELKKKEKIFKELAKEFKNKIKLSNNNLTKNQNLINQLLSETLADVCKTLGKTEAMLKKTNHKHIINKKPRRKK